MRLSRMRIVVMLFAVCLGMLLSLPAAAATLPTDTDYLNMIKRGHNYLFGAQNPAVYDGSGVYQSGGDWSDNKYGAQVAATGLAVAALIDTGVPRTDQHVIDGINYLRQVAKDLSPSVDPADLGKGGIYSGVWQKTYETGIALVAFNMFNDPADATLVTNAANLLIAQQGTEANSGTYAGGWDYYMDGYGGDMSNTQFGVMGLWSAYRYLGKQSSIATEDWANRVFGYLQRTQVTGFADPTYDGAFCYGPGEFYSFVGGSMTGAGLWSLGLIGKNVDVLGTPKGEDMKNAALKWFANNYRWDGNPGPSYSGDPTEAHYYFVYAMAKALAVSLDANTPLVGDSVSHDWFYGVAGVNGETVNGLRYTMYLMRDTTLEGDGDPAKPANKTFWYGPGWLDGGDILATSWAMMAIGFIDSSLPSPERILPPPVVDPVLDLPIEPGNVILNTGLGVLIEATKDNNNDPMPFRAPIAVGQKDGATVLPVGSLNFTLINVPVGGTAELRVELPASLMNEADPAFDEKKAFVNKDGTPKKTISWFKVNSLGVWRPLLNVPITVDRDAHVVVVTLTDGGPADQDGVANGVIVDPGALGFEVLTATPAGGLYATPQSVTLSSEPPATIYYTTNGSDPTTSSTPYSVPLTIAASTVLKFTTDGVNIKTENYVIGATFTVNFTAGANGTISGNASQTVGIGASTTAVTAVPDSGFSFLNWTGTGGFSSTSNPLTIANVTADMNVTANFVPTTVIVTAAATKPLSYKGARKNVKFTANAAIPLDTIKAAISADPWISIEYTNVRFANGKGVVYYSIEENADPVQRSGNIVIGNASYAVTQAAHPCKIMSVVINPLTPLVAAGGEQSVSVDIEPNSCQWKVVSYLVPPATWFSDVGSFPAAEQVLTGDQTFQGTVSVNTTGKSRINKIAIISLDGKSKKNITLKQGKL